MSKTYKRIDQKDKADQAKKFHKRELQDQTSKSTLNQFKQTGEAQREDIVDIGCWLLDNMILN